MKESEILFNYNQAMQQAGKLEEVAGKLERLSGSEMECTKNILSNAWQSDSSSQYYQKLDAVREKVLASSRQIRSIAAQLRDAARAVKSAELAALAIAEHRTY